MISSFAISTHIITFGLFFFSTLIYLVILTKLTHEVLFSAEPPKSQLVDALFYSEWATVYMASFADFTFLYLLNVLTSRFLAFEKSTKADD